MTATLRPRRLVAPPVNRLVAASIDLAIIVLPTVAVALLAAERFTLVGPAGAPDDFSVVDQARLDEIGGGFHRAVEFGGSLYALDVDGLLVTAATMIVAALLAHVIFPVFGDGRSPGKAVTGLRVVTDDGGPVGVGQHLIRTLAGPIDVLGLGIPGLLGTLLAWSDVDRRRLGDRLAETRVSGRPNEWLVADGPGRPAAANRRSTPTPTPTPPWAATAGSPSVPSPTATPALFQGHRPSPQWLGGSAMTEVPVTILLTDADRLDPTVDAPTPTPTPAPTPTPDPRHPAPPLRPIRRLDGSPTRSPRSRRGAIRAEIEARAAGSHATAGSGWLGGTADYDGWVATSNTSDTRAAAGTGSSVDRGAGSSPTGPYDTLLFPESSLAEATSAATIARPVDDRGDDLVIEPYGVDEPMWDGGRKAWVYRDRDTGRWFRHDAANDHWSPITS